MPIRVTVTGSESLSRKLDALGDAARGRMLERALVTGALVVQNDAKRRAPYRTGNLRRSIHIGGHGNLAPDRQAVDQVTGEPVPAPEIRQTGVAVYVGTDVQYARGVEYGFGGTDASGRSVNQSARPYLRPAIDTNRDEVGSEVAEALRDQLRAALR